MKKISISIIFSIIIAFICYPILIFFMINNKFIFNDNDIVYTMTIIILFEFSSLIIVWRYRKMKTELSQFNKIYNAKINSKESLIIITNSLDRSIIKNKLEYLLKSPIELKNNSENPNIGNYLAEHIRSKSLDVRYTIATLVLVGLLGTFVGLIHSVKSLENIFVANALTINDNTNDIITALGGSLKGINLAFGTSICGILSSILLGLIYNIYVIISDNYYNIITQESEILIKPYIYKVNYDYISTIFTESFNKIISNTLVGVIKKFESTINNLGVSTEKLTSAFIGQTELIEKYNQSAQNIKMASDNLIQCSNSLIEHDNKLTKIDEQIQSELNRINDTFDGINNSVIKIENNLKESTDYIISHLDKIVNFQKNEEKQFIDDLKIYTKTINELFENEKHHNLSFSEKTTKMIKSIETYELNAKKRTDNLNKILENSNSLKNASMEYLQFQKTNIIENRQLLNDFSKDIIKLTKTMERRQNRYFKFIDEVVSRLEKIYPYLKTFQFKK